jgi:hypothetical protein
VSLDPTAGGVSESSNGTVTAAKLLLQGAGTFTLNQSGNDVATLAANVNGALTYQDTNALTVGAVNGVNGITTNGHDVTLTTGALLTLGDGSATAQPIAAGTGTTSLKATAGGISEATNGTVAAAKLLLQGTGTFTLNQSGNDVATLAAAVTGALTYQDANALTVGTVGNTNGINTSNNDVTLTTGALLTLGDGSATAQPVAAGTATVSLKATAGGISESNNGAVTAAKLLLQGTGTFTLNQSGNDVATLAAAVTGSLTYQDANALTVATVGSTNGISTGSNDVSLTTGGLLTLGDGSATAQPIAAGTGTASLKATTGGISEAGNGAVTAAKLLLQGTGTFTLNQSANDVTTLAAAVTGSLTYQDANALTVATVGTTNGITTGGQDLTLTTGALLTLGDGSAAAKNLTATGATVTITTNAGGVTENTDAAILADKLLLKGTGTFGVGQLNNDVATLAADVTGDLTYEDANSLTVGTVGGTVGINTHGGKLTLTTGGNLTPTTDGTLTVSQTVTAGITTFTNQGTLKLGSNVTATGGFTQNGAGSVLLTADSIVDAGSGNIDFQRTVDGGFNLTAKSQGNTRFEMAVGTTPLASLKIDGGGAAGSTASLVGVHTTNDQTYDAHLTTFSGAFTSDAGNLAVKQNAQLGAAATVKTGSAAGNLTFDGDVGLATFTLTVDDAGAATVSGKIGGTTGGLTKKGAGMLTLPSTAPDSDYQGSTEIDAGTMLIDSKLTMSPVTLNVGTLAGSGQAHGITANGGTVAPGPINRPAIASITDHVPLVSGGVFTSMGPVTLSAGVSFNVRINGMGQLGMGQPVAGADFDQLSVAGTFTPNGATLVPTLGTASAVGDVFKFVAAAGVNNAAPLSNYNGLLRFQQFPVSVMGGNLVLTHKDTAPAVTNPVEVRDPSSPIVVFQTSPNVPSSVRTSAQTANQKLADINGKPGHVPTFFQSDVVTRTYQFTDPDELDQHTTTLDLGDQTIITMKSAAASAAISAASEMSTTVTITTAAANGFAVGQHVTIAGITPAGYDGTFTITSVNAAARTFTYTAAAGLGAATLNTARATVMTTPNFPTANDVYSFTVSHQYVLAQDKVPVMATDKDGNKDGTGNDVTGVQSGVKAVLDAPLHDGNAQQQQNLATSAVLTVVQQPIAMFQSLAADAGLIAAGATPFRVTVDWGDGSPPETTPSPNIKIVPGTLPYPIYTVLGTHGYHPPGNPTAVATGKWRVTVTVVDILPPSGSSPGSLVVPVPSRLVGSDGSPIFTTLFTGTGNGDLYAATIAYALSHTGLSQKTLDLLRAEGIDSGSPQALAISALVTVEQTLFTQAGEVAVVRQLAAQLKVPLDAATLNNYVQFLAHGGTRQQLAVRIVASPAYRGLSSFGDWVNRMYSDYFRFTGVPANRLTAAQLLNTFIITGGSYVAVADRAIRSGVGNMGNREEIQYVFNTFVGRPALESELQRWQLRMLQTNENQVEREILTDPSIVLELQKRKIHVGQTQNVSISPIPPQ